MAEKMNHETIDRLIEKSKEIMSQAHCPYSNFPVGAAILTKDGSVFDGCNIENAAYTLGICAERVAASKAVSSGHKDDWKCIAISSLIQDDFIGPCGACRQFLMEFAPNLVLYLTKADGSYKEVTLSELLPFTFTTEQLRSATKSPTSSSKLPSSD